MVAAKDSRARAGRKSLTTLRYMRDLRKMELVGDLLRSRRARLGRDLCWKKEGARQAAALTDCCWVPLRPISITAKATAREDLYVSEFLSFSAPKDPRNRG